MLKKEEKTYLRIQRLQFETIVLFLYYILLAFFIFLCTLSWFVVVVLNRQTSHNHNVSKAKIWKWILVLRTYGVLTLCIYYTTHLIVLGIDHGLISIRRSSKKELQIALRSCGNGHQGWTSICEWKWVFFLFLLFFCWTFVCSSKKISNLNSKIKDTYNEKNLLVKLGTRN